VPVAPDEQKRVESAGISTEAVDVAAVFQRLKEEVQGATSGSWTDGATRPQPARLEAERLWAVAVDTPIERRAGLRARLTYPVKRFLRRLMSWYVSPFAVDQRNFNHSLLRLVDDLTAQLDAEAGRLSALEAHSESIREEADRQMAASREKLRQRGRRIAELEERVLRLERARRPAARPEPAAAVDGAAVDYFTFEARMRGSTTEIRDRQRPYVELFRDAAPVLDVGCGRGEFLSLLRDAGIDARGVELDSDMAAFARGEGLDVVDGDALAYLERLPDGELGGIFSAQLVEHLMPGALLRLLELASVKLRPGGVFVAETINPLSPLSLRTYFADLSHVQPVVPETLAILARQAGLAVDEIRFLHEPDDRLRAVELPDPDAHRALAHNVRLLNEHVFAALDYALLARRP
jgi:SAM-dependent methyltransferase